MPNIATLERRIVRVESLLIGLSIALIASGDFFLGKDVSLGYLYLIPLSYSVLTHRWPVTIALILLCVTLRQSFGPIQREPAGLIVRDWALTIVFAVVAVALHRLGVARRRFFETARKQRDELVREVHLAARVQRQLLARRSPPQGRFEIAARTYPARGVGGDYFDFLDMGSGRLGIVIADVAGKGLPAAMLMPAVQIALRSLARTRSPLSEMIGELNVTLCDTLPPSSYATLFLGSLDLGSGHFEYVNAGHLPPLVLRGGLGPVERLEAGGSPPGLLRAARYDTGECVLGAADLLLFYTDGVTEAAAPSGEDFGVGRLAAAAAANWESSARAILEAVRAAAESFRGEARRQDDLTLIVVKAPESTGPAQIESRSPPSSESAS